jgi:hypothetical protein
VSLVTIRVTRAEAHQLLSYLQDRDQGDGAGWYYGDKAQFEKRHESIREVLTRAIERHASTSNEVQP